MHNRGKLKLKFLGSLVGAAIGDGLGSWREGKGMAKREEIDPETFLLKLQNFAQNQLYKEKIANIKELLGEQNKARVVATLGNGIEAPRSVPTAIYSFLKHSSAYKDSIVYAISLGGDTDTIASMAGAISGAYLGIEAIPEEWKAKLENRAYIEALAEELWQIATS